jgi:hypothetical protein
MALKEYKPGTTFPGRMGRTIGESEPAWPAPLRAKESASNMDVISLNHQSYSSDQTGRAPPACTDAAVKLFAARGHRKRGTPN